MVRKVFFWSHIRRFNPRTYTRCDHVTNFLTELCDRFQSAHLHEVRSSSAANRASRLMFQSAHSIQSAIYTDTSNFPLF